MKQSDIAALMRGVAPAVRDLVVDATRPLLERIAEMERQLANAPAAKDGRDGIDGRDGVDGKDGADGAPGRDGRDAPEVTPEQMGEAVARYLAAYPPTRGQDGRDGRDGADGAPGRDGKDAAEVTPEQIAEAVARYLDAHPPLAGKDGRDGADGQDGAPGEKGEPGRDGVDGKDGARGQDGAGVADAVIDRDGALVLTMTDGRTKSLGVVVGRDGANGQPGVPGTNGADGVGFDDLDIVETDDGLAFRFVRGEVVKEFPLPLVVDRGVFSEGATYRKGNGVTWGGSFWIAQKDAPEGKPDSPNSGWRLAVKRGQNGKDAAK